MLYVMNDDNNLVYKVTLSGGYPVNMSKDRPKDSTIHWDLELVAGKEYIAPDYTDDQDWVTADAFVDDVRYESIIQYVVVESLESALAEEGYHIIPELPAVYQYGRYPYRMDRSLTTM